MTNFNGYAVVCAKNGLDVTVAERNNRVGKKIAMSGNGKCNVGNANVNAGCFNKSNIVKNVLDEISVSEYVKFLESLGVYTYADGEGRMYPLSDSASNVVDCFRYQLFKYGATVLCDAEVTSCKRVNGTYEVKINGVKYVFDKVVLACGSNSQSPDSVPFGIVSQNIFTDRVPSLVPVKIHNMEGILNGIRVKAEVSLYDGALCLGKQSGEVLFKDYGLSGI
ncbi:MAG: NAD(P)/FAD-dependent oxidoreductase, partial [Clostridia bacterium]|nr:NAD(P)/FAD-dependent oxidoreductase [Clostridia bacterium]